MDRRYLLLGLLGVPLFYYFPEKKLVINKPKKRFVFSSIKGSQHYLIIFNFFDFKAEVYESPNDIHEVIWNDAFPDYVFTVPLWGKTGVGIFSLSERKFIHTIKISGNKFEFAGHGVFSEDKKYLFVGLSHYQTYTDQERDLEGGKSFVAKIDLRAPGFKIVSIYDVGGVEPQQLIFLNSNILMIVNSGTRGGSFVGKTSLIYFDIVSEKTLSVLTFGEKGSILFGHMIRADSNLFYLCGGISKVRVDSIWNLTPCVGKLDGGNYSIIFEDKKLKGSIFNVSTDGDFFAFNFHTTNKIIVVNKHTSSASVYDSENHFGPVMSYGKGKFAFGHKDSFSLFDDGKIKVRPVDLFPGVFGPHSTVLWIT